MAHVIRPSVDRRARGAFFTPPLIADFLAAWAVSKNPTATVLDPTCGEAVFLLSAGRRLATLGRSKDDLGEQLLGIDLHSGSLSEAEALLAAEGMPAHLVHSDFFDVPTPDQLGCPFPYVDAVIGNPPFVRYQQHFGEDRRRSREAALRQGVRLSGLASSWAAVLVHACAFLKPEGRLAIVLPAELLTVHYAQPIRQWLKRRFAAVNLVMFERLQFEDAQENVVLLLARGTGGCDAFTLDVVDDAEDLAGIEALEQLAVTPTAEGKWTDLLIPVTQRQLFRRVCEETFVRLEDYGRPELGTVTGKNDYFTISEATKQAHGLSEDQLVRVSPPGTRHLRGLTFSASDWQQLRDGGERVWLLHPDADDTSPGLLRYIREGEKEGVHGAYKCQVRQPWWRPPLSAVPDLFFTYMSHRYPRLVANRAGVNCVNSMHGIRLKPGVPRVAKSALPLLAFNSVTMLGAELHGRSYGGGILKMEPREAASLPVPEPTLMAEAWKRLGPERDSLDRQLRDGRWTSVLARVDEVLLRDAAGLDAGQVEGLHAAARTLRERRIRRPAVTDDE